VQKKDCVSIKFCRLCNSKNLKKVFDLGRTPLANSYLKIEISKKLRKYPLKLNYCNNCGHLQLTHSIKPSKMFSNYLYKTNTSKKNFLHFKSYANEIKKMFKNRNTKILDIASNDGTFLNFFEKKKFFRLGIDPAKNLKKLSLKKGITQIDDFFTMKKSENIKKKYGKFDIITANHVCAHVEDLNDFFNGVQNLLKDEGLFVFEISYRASVLKKNTFDTIYHEHLDYHALYPISKFVKKFNLNVVNFKTPDAQGGSLRVYVSKNKNSKNQKSIKKQILKEKKQLNLFNVSTYKKFEKKIINCKNKLNSLIQNCINNNMSIAGYGAAAKTTTFLNYFKISEKNIKFIFDDNKLKQGLCIPGTKIKILDPLNMNKKNIDVLIIFAWNYAELIIAKNKKFKKKGGKFLIPFPNPRLI
jgi:2-polyprenyl-3-methyl-5-hydroxy-6-metoxy-1,4-benzoquinol methylase|tara:strand:- start:3 stop:1244 length:1242 start_codon:yes stop_codon:yes gene_type:complete